MRSIYTKLILGFVLTSFISVIIVVVLVSVQARAEFGDFVTGRDRENLTVVLEEYYEHNDGWDGLETFLQSDSYYRAISVNLVVADDAGAVVLANQSYIVGAVLSEHELEEGFAIVNDGTLAGYALVEEAEFGEVDELSLEGEFLEELASAITVSGVAALLVAVVLGSLFAGIFSRPLRELTFASKAIAEGELGQQVTVKSKDEIGQLSAAFNQMSASMASAIQIRKQMTADIAHDLRTPLTILRSYSEGLLDGKLEASSETYQIMHDEVLHLQHLVEDLRTLSLADGGELRLDKTTLDPKHLLERVGLAYARKAEQQGLELRVEVETSLPEISVDVERMTQVINNLVSNALRNTESGEVVLAARLQAGRVRLSVKDSGVGIPVQDLAHVFERFYRADSDRQRQSDGGSGLGLAIAKAIVTAHGGEIGVHSTVGVGTEVWMML